MPWPSLLQVSCYTSQELEIAGQSTIHKCSMSSLLEQLPLFVSTITEDILRFSGGRYSLA